MKTSLPYHPKYNQLSAEEEALLSEALSSVEFFVKRSKRISDVNYATRDAHAKSYAYIKAVFEPSHDESVKEFFPQDLYESLVRLSHANLKISKSDKQLPVFGFALKIYRAESKEVNYPLVNFPVFPTDSVKGFLKLFIKINQFFTSSFLLKPLKVLGIISAVSPMFLEMLNLSFFNAVKTWVKNFHHFILARSYYSVGVYRLGNKMIKLKLVPKLFDPEFKVSESIHENVKAYLHQEKLQYDIFYQLAYNENDQPINTLTRDWKNTEFRHFGTLTNLQVVEEYGLELEKLSFNPFVNMEALQPVGKIQHLRKSVYEKSEKIRNNLNR